MFRFIGRLYFWLVLVPSFLKYFAPALTRAIEDLTEKMRMSMTEEQRARYDRIYPPRSRRATPNNTPAPADNRPPKPIFPTGFQAPLDPNNSIRDFINRHRA